MKKFFGVFLSFLTALSLCSCNDNNVSSQNNAVPASNTVSEADPEKPENDDASKPSVQADPGLFDVTITLNSEIVGETTQEKEDQYVKENGFKSATLNDDGSVTYVMSKSKHNELMADLKSSFEESFQEIAESEDYPNITSIEANDDYTVFKISLENGEVGLVDSFVTIVCYAYGGMYGSFNGTPSDNINVQFVDAKTGSIIEEANSNDVN
ncbi:MAG: hypothetical protein HFE62_04950 [Firmicutes bacterium]|nr:hypothetical protein [Bacillota bacterium]